MQVQVYRRTSSSSHQLMDLFQGLAAGTSRLGNRWPAPLESSWAAFAVVEAVSTGHLDVQSSTLLNSVRVQGLSCGQTIHRIHPHLLPAKQHHPLAGISSSNQCRGFADELRS